MGIDSKITSIDSKITSTQNKISDKIASKLTSVQNSTQKTKDSSAKVYQTVTTNSERRNTNKINSIVSNAKSTVTNVLGTVSSVAGVIGKIAGNSKLGKMINGSQTTKYGPDLNTKTGYYYEESGLKGFYDTFSGNSASLYQHIDTSNLFECYFEFFPLLMNGNQYSSRIADILKGYGIQDGNGKNQLQSNSIYVDLGVMIQKMTIPNMSIPQGENINTLVGNFITNGIIVQPDSNTFMMEVINLRNPLLDKIMYPWMREVTLPQWSYDSQPYTTARVTVDFSEHVDLKYVFVGVRPQQIQSLQPSQDPNTSFTRQVSFIFDYMFICKGSDNEWNDTDSNYTNNTTPTFSMNFSTKSSTLDKVSSIANSVLFSGGNILKI